MYHNDTENINVPNIMQLPQVLRLKVSQRTCIFTIKHGYRSLSTFIKLTDVYIQTITKTDYSIDRLQSTPSWLIFRTHGKQKASILYL